MQTCLCYPKSSSVQLWSQWLVRLSCICQIGLRFLLCKDILEPYTLWTTWTSMLLQRSRETQTQFNLQWGNDTMVCRNCYWTYFVPTTFIVFIRVCSSSMILERPKSAIFGTMLSSNNMLAGWRFRWTIGLSLPLCRYSKPWQMPLIILKHVAQLGLEDSSEAWKHGSCNIQKNAFLHNWWQNNCVECFIRIQKMHLSRFPFAAYSCWAVYEL